MLVLWHTWVSSYKFKGQDIVMQNGQTDGHTATIRIVAFLFFYTGYCKEFNFASLTSPASAAIDWALYVYCEDLPGRAALALDFSGRSVHSLECRWPFTMFHFLTVVLESRVV